MLNLCSGPERGAPVSLLRARGWLSRARGWLSRARGWPARARSSVVPA